jgi:lipoate-protein ligase A
VTAGWTVHHSHGDTAAFHAAVPEPVRSLTFHTVDRPTLVLGSAQAASDVDRRVADGLGVDVVGRRSGGGAVLLWPGEFVWLDVVIPVDDRRWDADVGRAMVWVGKWWAVALAGLGVQGTVHVDGLRGDDWSRQVCWTSVGTGEVMAGASKLVGISQRRTRHLARFQTMCHLRWRPEVVAALVAPPRPTGRDLATAAAVVPATELDLRQALLDTAPPA